jgi:hypothetical protein
MKKEKIMLRSTNVLRHSRFSVTPYDKMFKGFHVMEMVAGFGPVSLRTFPRKHLALAYALELGNTTMVEKTNVMTGKKFLERENTPYHCSPASESYWSN